MIDLQAMLSSPEYRHSAKAKRLELTHAREIVAGEWPFDYFHRWLNARENAKLRRDGFFNVVDAAPLVAIVRRRSYRLS